MDKETKERIDRLRKMRTEAEIMYDDFMEEELKSLNEEED